MKKPSFNVIWKRIIDHAGRTFLSKRCLPFTYEVAGTTVKPSRTNWNIPKHDFEDAYNKVPFVGPGVISQTHQGPSYIWGILHDPRIIYFVSKYDPLELFLRCTPLHLDNITLSFRQIEIILGFRLPPAAFKHRAWWANTHSHSHAESWIQAGFEVDKNGVNLEQCWVRFKRKAWCGANTCHGEQ